MVSVMSVGLYALLALQIGFLIQLPFCFAFSGIFTSYELSLTVGSAWVISIIPFPHPLTIPISSLNITTITTMPEPRNLLQKPRRLDLGTSKTSDGSYSVHPLCFAAF